MKPSLIPEAGLGVFAKKFIARNVKVGPYKGKRLSVYEMENIEDTSYIWEVGITTSTILKVFTDVRGLFTI